MFLSLSYLIVIIGIDRSPPNNALNTQLRTHSKLQRKSLAISIIQMRSSKTTDKISSDLHNILTFQNLFLPSPEQTKWDCFTKHPKRYKYFSRSCIKIFEWHKKICELPKSLFSRMKNVVDNHCLLLPDLTLNLPTKKNLHCSSELYNKRRERSDRGSGNLASWLLMTRSADRFSNPVGSTHLLEN